MMVAKSKLSKRRSKIILRQKICPNCLTQLNEDAHFCCRCGQENRPRNQPLKHLFLEFLEVFFHFDTKFWRTTYLLFLKPGVITREYVEEKRARFVPPMRLYIFVSVVFFIILGYTGKTDKSATVPVFSSDSIQQDPMNLRIGTSLITMNKSDLKGNSGDQVSDEKIDSALKKDGITPESGVVYNLARGFTKLAYQKGSKKAFLKNLYSYFSISMYVLMPLFALVLSALYFRRRKNYYEYLIFSIHYHSLIFIILCLISLAIAITGTDYFYLVFLLFPFYLLFAMRNCYQQRWGKTIAKWILINVSYSLILFLTFLVLIMVSVYNL
ncbi:MAG: DUF3667 domain-containing protein [Bacteroidetes bacterium]|nr:DUF3667 domain-containing protein [Bacteroidota bacterium]